MIRKNNQDYLEETAYFIDRKISLYGHERSFISVFGIADIKRLLTSAFFLQNFSSDLISKNNQNSLQETTYFIGPRITVKDTKEV